MAQSIKRLEQLMRNQGGALPEWTNVADWCDALVLVASTAQTYALKTDAAGLRGTKLRVTSAMGPLYINVRTTATVPTATTTDGSSSILLIPGTATQGGQATIVWPGHDLSFICANAGVVTIEAFD